MRLDDMLESKFLKQADFPKDRLLTVSKITRQNMAKEDEVPEYRWTMFFEELPKAMVLNSTNLKRAFRFLGDDSDDWIGKKVVVFVDPDVEYAGKTVGGLRLRAPKNGSPAAAPNLQKPPRESENPADDLTDDIPFN